MAGNQRPTMLIYPEEKEFLRNSTLQYQNIETGGDLFGLWQNESEVVVQLVTGPGEYCRRTPTAFFQDRTYLSNVGGYLTTAKGLCNIGEWHSHHRLNLPEPSGGDKATVWRNMPGCGLKRFLLIIATITPTGQVNINGFMLTAPRNGSSNGGIERVETRVLNGQNPFRSLPDVVAKLHEGVETPGPEEYISPPLEPSRPDSQGKKPTESNSKETKPDKKHNFGRIFGLKKGPSYKHLGGDGGTSGYFSSASQRDSVPESSTRSTSNVKETYYHDQPSHVPAQQRNENGNYQPTISPASHTVTQTPSYKVTYQSYV